MTTLAIAEYLSPEQKARILAEEYHLVEGKFLLTKDTQARCALAVAAGVPYSPGVFQAVRLLGIPLIPVQDFMYAADNGRIRSRAQLAAALGVTLED